MKNRIIFKHLVLIAVMLGGVMSAFAEDKSNNELQCSQNSTVESVKKGNFTAIWVCPKLPNLPANIPVRTSIADIDFFSGNYVCDYFHDEKGGSGMLASCRFKSASYKKNMDDIQDNILGTKLTGASGTVLTGLIAEGNPIKLLETFNTYSFYQDATETKEIKTLEIKINEIIKKLKETADNAKNSNNSLFKAEASLKDINTLSYKHLVAPYVQTPNGDMVKKDANFALFLAGLVTLDPDIVSGYNEASGKMKVSPQWSLKAKTLSTDERAVFSEIKSGLKSAGAGIMNVFASIGLGSKVEDLDVEKSRGYMLNISSWIDVFEMKLWGFFYHLNQRLDLGYDIISTQLLSIMMVWFMMAAGTKSGISYILNKEGVQQQVQPAIIKTLTTLLAVGVFYVSLSTPKQSDYVTTQEADFPQEMQKNRTMMKWLIRYSAAEGSKMATMLSDLGLDAFLTFVVKKQQVFTSDELSSVFASDISKLRYYFPATQIVHSCRGLYGMSDMNFINRIDSTGLNINKNFVSIDPFFDQAGVDKISYNACMNGYKLIGTVGSDIIRTAVEAEQRIENVNAVMAKAVSFLVKNNIMLQDKMGWVNTFTIPITYFMMKENDMFLSVGIDSDKIDEEAEKFSKSLGYADASDINFKKDRGEDKKGFFTWISDGSSEIENAVGHVAAYASSTISQFMLWNILPGYASIRTGIYDYFSKVYGDYFETNLHKKKNKESYMKDLLSGNIGAVSSITPVGKVYGKLKDWVLNKLSNPFVARTGIMAMSFIAAYYIWKTSFMIMFISSIAIMILLKIVLYFKDLLIHTFISIFVVVWAFASQQSGGQKMTNYLKDTMILMIYPSMIVLSTFIFIFVYELFYTLYLFIMKTMLYNQKMNISLMGMGHNDTDSFNAYFTIYMMDEFAQVLIYVFTLVLAYTTIIQLPELILKKLGLNDSSINNISQSSEKSMSKGEKTTNPLMQ